MYVFAFLCIAGAALAAPSATNFDDERNSRGMTWSNFVPGGGVSFWSSATDDFWTPDSDQPQRLLPNSDFDFQNHGANRWPATDDLLKPPPTPSAAPGAGDEPEQQTPSSHEAPPKNLRPFDDDRERRPLKPSRGSWPNKKGHFNGDEDERKYSGANASVNAWFPIMLGMMPPADGTTRSEKSDASNNGDKDEPRSITVVANSVNHASRGRANAHTVLFAGSDPSASFRRFGRSLVLIR